jgi:hypothetical protein
LIPGVSQAFSVKVISVARNVDSGAAFENAQPFLLPAPASARMILKPGKSALAWKTVLLQSREIRDRKR